MFFNLISVRELKYSNSVSVLTTCLGIFWSCRLFTPKLSLSILHKEQLLRLQRAPRKKANRQTFLIESPLCTKVSNVAYEGRGKNGGKTVKFIHRV